VAVVVQRQPLLLRKPWSVMPKPSHQSHAAAAPKPLWLWPSLRLKSPQRLRL